MNDPSALEWRMSERFRANRHSNTRTLHSRFRPRSGKETVSFRGALYIDYSRFYASHYSPPPRDILTSSCQRVADAVCALSRQLSWVRELTNRISFYKMIVQSAGNDIKLAPQRNSVESRTRNNYFTENFKRVFLERAFSAR